MKTNRTFTIVFFCFLAVVLVLFFYFNFRNKRYNWYENYKAESDQPYGTAFIMKLLEKETPGSFTYNTKKPLREVLTPSLQNSAYVFIGNGIFFDSTDAEALVNFIARGNDAFIACEFAHNLIIRQVLTNECTEEVSYFNTKTITVQANFYNPAFYTTTPYSFSYRMQDEDIENTWHYLDPSMLCDSVKSLVPLGYLEPSHVNFFKIPYGEGNLYIHTNPVMFSNYFMAKEENLPYASSAFSHLKYDDLIWDEFSKIPMRYYGNDLRNSPLYFMMQQPSLRYAWWVLLVSIILYILFVAKRKQKIIPVMEPRTNTSLQFINTIASLHYHHQNHSDMARKKMRHFLHHVRTRYNLSTQKTDDVFIRKLSLKSDVSEQDIQTIFDHYRVVEKFKDITVSRLAEFYNLIDNFYKQGK